VTPARLTALTAPHGDQAVAFTQYVVVSRHLEQPSRQFGQISADSKILQLITAYKKALYSTRAGLRNELRGNYEDQVSASAAGQSSEGRSGDFLPEPGRKSLGF
jgi:hypothetical protein